MSSNERPSAWVAVPSGDELPEQVKETIRPISEKVGFVPNVARLLAITSSAGGATSTT